MLTRECGNGGAVPAVQRWNLARLSFRTIPWCGVGLWPHGKTADIAAVPWYPPNRSELIMADAPSRTYTTPSIDTGASLPSAPKPKEKGRWKITAVLLLLVLPLAAFALWVTIALSFSYASGDRAGIVQKLSNKGWVCKTWEGELSMANGPNVMPEMFKFTVRDEKVAETINNSLGRQVKLAYEQHKGVPTQCFGETEYFVNKVEVIGAPGANPAATTAPSAATPALPTPTPVAPAPPRP
jgi:hypothetical protein